MNKTLTEADHFRAAGVTFGDLLDAGARIPRGFRLTAASNCDTGEDMHTLKNPYPINPYDIGVTSAAKTATGDGMKTSIGKTPPNTPRAGLPKASAVSGGVLVKTGSGPGPTKPPMRPTSRKR